MHNFSLGWFYPTRKRRKRTDRFSGVHIFVDATSRAKSPKEIRDKARTHTPHDSPRDTKVCRGNARVFRICIYTVSWPRSLASFFAFLLRSVISAEKHLARGNLRGFNTRIRHGAKRGAEAANKNSFSSANFPSFFLPFIFLFSFRSLFLHSPSFSDFQTAEWKSYCYNSVSLFSSSPCSFSCFFFFFFLSFYCLNPRYIWFERTCPAFSLLVLPKVTRRLERFVVETWEF